MKLRRPKLAQRYAEVIASLYAESEAPKEGPHIGRAGKDA
jgi:hypothetical protein